MNVELLCKAIHRLRPGAAYIARGSDPSLADVVWYDQTQVKPSQAEFDAAVAAEQADVGALAARRATDAGERAEARLDSAILALVNATPLQLRNYAQNNFPSLTLAEQNRLGTILAILAVAVRPEIR